MIDQLAALIVDEGKWPTLAMGLALASAMVLLYRHRDADFPMRRRILAAMTLFFGVSIGTLAFGHLLAVTTKLASGTLRGSFPLPVLYLIGIALAVPAGWLSLHTRRVLVSDQHGRATLMLNSWLGVTLLALGIPNLPLALPALFNIGYHLHSRRAMGWAIVSLAVVLNVGLFVGSLIFLASGQSFEQFSGME